MTRVSAGAADLVATTATSGEDAFGDHFPTRPIAVGRTRVGLVLHDRPTHFRSNEYGSEEEAARWVATPDTSPHVSGDAIDIGPTAAAGWLSEHGADRGWPRPYADPTHDPRMQQ